MNSRSNYVTPKPDLTDTEISQKEERSEKTNTFSNIPYDTTTCPYFNNPSKSQKDGEEPLELV